MRLNHWMNISLQSSSQTGQLEMGPSKCCHADTASGLRGPSLGKYYRRCTQRMPSVLNYSENIPQGTAGMLYHLL